MTKKLEEFFNLAQDTQPESEDQETLFAEQKQELQVAKDLIDKIDAALPQVNDLDNADTELDELSDMAREKFEDLMNLGMNVEARFSGQILQTAGVLLGHAITAKQAKIDKKLKMIDLQLKKLRLDQTSGREQETSKPIDGQAVVIDRNQLLKQILAGQSENKENNK